MIFNIDIDLEVKFHNRHLFQYTTLSAYLQSVILHAVRDSTAASFSFFSYYWHEGEAEDTSVCTAINYLEVHVRRVSRFVLG